MNRRGFLIGAIIAPLGAMLPIGYVSWLEWKPKSYLYVVPTPRQAKALYNELGRPKNVKVIATGGMICGYGADLIIMDENWESGCSEVVPHSLVRKAVLKDWFNTTLRCRLYPGGRIITKRLT